jgi:hypothetical protein
LPTPINHKGILQPMLLAVMTPVAVASETALPNLGLRLCRFLIVDVSRMLDPFRSIL